MKKEIPLSVPNLNRNIIPNLAECIETGWVSTGGRFIAEFEEKMARYAGVPDAVSCQSGTAGLHVALRLLGVEPGDGVIVPTLTFIAAVNPVVYQGARPFFMDCDDSLCLDPVKLERFLKEECEAADGRVTHRASGRRIGALVVVHVFGNLAGMEQILDISRRWGIPVLEDATEALGTYCTEGTLKGMCAGTLGDIGVYSFNANKIITTGGGGMLVSRNKAYTDQARYLTTTAKNDILHFVHDEVGYNYRMLNIQAALGVSQIEELEAFIRTKERNYKEYLRLLDGIPGLSLLPFREGCRANHWFYSLYVDEEAAGLDRDRLMEALLEEGIQCRPVWKLIHTQKAYEKEVCYRIERAPEYRNRVLNLPCSTNLRVEEVAYVAAAIRAVVEAARAGR